VPGPAGCRGHGCRHRQWRRSEVAQSASAGSSLVVTPPPYPAFLIRFYDGGSGLSRVHGETFRNAAGQRVSHDTRVTSKPAKGHV
jgi:hypothetical protein